MEFNFPAIPKSKIYGEQFTPEQEALMHYFDAGKLTSDDEKILQECLNFYADVFKYLKSLPLSSFNEEDAKIVWEYLKQAFNTKWVVQNDIDFKIIFRVTIVKDAFLEKDKIRDPKYLHNPPLEINIKNGVYNRGNSPNSTMFYASFYENVAIRETKPQKGDRIIITIWENRSGKPFVSFPISHASIENNEGVLKATNAFKKKMENHHPLFVEHFRIHLDFLASEFVKDKEVVSEKKYEYLFSAFFSEFTLSEKNPQDPSPDYDFIIYPSVAFKHQEDNICIKPDSINKLRPAYLREFYVEETYCDKPLTLEDAPVKLKLLRDATWIEPELIIWNDE